MRAKVGALLLMGWIMLSLVPEAQAALPRTKECRKVARACRRAGYFMKNDNTASSKRKNEDARGMVEKCFNDLMSHQKVPALESIPETLVQACQRSLNEGGPAKPKGKGRSRSSKSKGKRTPTPSATPAQTS